MSTNRPPQPTFGTKSATPSTRIERLRHRIRAARIFDEIASGNLTAPTPWDDCGYAVCEAEEADWHDERDADYRAELDRDARGERGSAVVAFAILAFAIGVLAWLAISLSDAMFPVGAGS